MIDRQHGWAGYQLCLIGLLIPLWHWQNRAAMAERLSIRTALVPYVMAKLAELYDYEIAQAGIVSGHMPKYVLATLAASAVVSGLVWRTRNRMPRALAITALSHNK